MTHSSTKFNTYTLKTKKITVDGPPITVAGQGNIKLTPSLPLQNFLHFPKLPTNLISIPEITRNLNCQIFFDTRCVVQDRSTGKKIEVAKRKKDSII